MRMSGHTTKRIGNILALLFGGACICVIAVYVTLMVSPGLAFRHSAGDGRIMFHSTEPLSQDAAVDAAAEAWGALSAAPSSLTELQTAVTEAFAADGPTLIYVTPDIV